MAHTFHQVHIQTVFAPKYRDAVLRKKLRPEIFGIIGDLIDETGCKTIIINGVEDHVHCFLGLKPAISISDLMKIVKARSSKYINDRGLMNSRFEWQEGYGVFSHSHSDLNKIYHYIANQEEHHRHQSFKDEYLRHLLEHDIPFEEQTTFEDLI